jgi:hypothetical protein
MTRRSVQAFAAQRAGVNEYTAYSRRQLFANAAIAASRARKVCPSKESKSAETPGRTCP